jgi:hypothetical protein
MPRSKCLSPLNNEVVGAGLSTEDEQVLAKALTTDILGNRSEPQEDEVRTMYEACVALLFLLVLISRTAGAMHGPWSAN